MKLSKSLFFKAVIAPLIALAVFLLPAPYMQSAIYFPASQPAAASDVYTEELTGIETVQLSENNYEIRYNGTSKKIKLGNGTSSFTPALLISSWDEECQIELTLDSNVTGAIRNSVVYNPDGSLTVGNSNFSFYYKPVAVVPGFNEYGGLDFVLTVNKNPKTNVLPFIYNDTLVTAYRQPPLTEEYIPGWSDEFQANITVTETDVTDTITGEVYIHRPDYVVNSIAFYHETKGGIDIAGGVQYKTGKVGHLYRLKVTDSSANTTWGDWSVSGNQIYLTVNPAFLSAATYPITIAPVGDTFGYTTQGATDITAYDTVWSSLNAYSPGSDGTATAMYVCARNDGASPYGIKAGIYTGVGFVDLGGGQQATLLIGAGAGKNWYSAAFPSSFNVFSASSYWMAHVQQDSLSQLYVYEDDTDVDRRYAIGTSYATGLPNPISWTSSTTDRTWSIYCVFTPGGGGGWTVITKICGVTATDFAKIDTVSVDDIAKVNGVAVN